MSEYNEINPTQEKLHFDAITIIGLGLIGGSLGLALKENNISTRIIGVDNNPLHCNKALALALVDEISPLEEAIKQSKIIFIAIPVNAASALLPSILAHTSDQIIIDTGSTKENICSTATLAQKRNRFVAAHPMWGTEFSGPEAAVKNAFKNKAVVICDKQDSDHDAMLAAENIFKNIGMHIIYMDAKAHDLHAAYVSHISHITSFALANTVLEKEKEERAIFELASGGFESTVRLAKSNPMMWTEIFMQNKENVLDVLNEHISQLKKFKSCLEKENFEMLNELMTNANKIKTIVK